MLSTYSDVVRRALAKSKAQGNDEDYSHRMRVIKLARLSGVVIPDNLVELARELVRDELSVSELPKDDLEQLLLCWN